MRMGRGLKNFDAGIGKKWLVFYEGMNGEGLERR